MQPAYPVSHRGDNFARRECQYQNLITDAARYGTELIAKDLQTLAVLVACLTRIPKNAVLRAKKQSRSIAKFGEGTAWNWPDHNVDRLEPIVLGDETLTQLLFA